MTEKLLLWKVKVKMKKKCAERRDICILTVCSTWEQVKRKNRWIKEEDEKIAEIEKATTLPELTEYAKIHDWSLHQWLQFIIEASCNRKIKLGKLHGFS